jgi:hypothetical protein
LVHCCGAHAIRRASSVPNQLGCRDARPISEPERAPAPGPVIVSALATAPLRWPDHRENNPSWGLVPCTWKTVFPTSPRAGRSKWHWPNCRRWPREPSYPDLRRRRSRRWAEPSFAAGARTLPLLRPRPCRTPLSAVGLTGGGRHDGGVEVTEGQRHGLELYDAEDPPADEKGRPLYARRLDYRLAVCGSKRAPRQRLLREPLPLKTTGGARNRGEDGSRRVHPQGGEYAGERRLRVMYQPPRGTFSLPPEVGTVSGQERRGERGDCQCATRAGARAWGRRTAGHGPRRTGAQEGRVRAPLRGEAVDREGEGDGRL